MSIRGAEKLLRKVIGYALWSIPASVFLIVSGFVITHYIIGTPDTLDFTLFVLGAIPIVFFLPSLFSKSTSGALHTPKVIFRKVQTPASTDADREAAENRISSSSPLSLVLAGLTTWLAGLLLYL